MPKITIVTCLNILDRDITFFAQTKVSLVKHLPLTQSVLFFNLILSIETLLCFDFLEADPVSIFPILVKSRHISILLKSPLKADFKSP